MVTVERTRRAMTEFAAAIDARDWGRLASTLGPEFQAHYVHTGDRFGREQFVALTKVDPSGLITELVEVWADGIDGVDSISRQVSRPDPSTAR